MSQGDRTQITEGGGEWWVGGRAMNLADYNGFYPLLIVLREN